MGQDKERNSAMVQCCNTCSVSLCSRAEAIAPCATIISHTMVLVGALVEREWGGGTREWARSGEEVSAAL